MHKGDQKKNFGLAVQRLMGIIPAMVCSICIGTGVVWCCWYGGAREEKNRLQAGESWGPHGSEPECPLCHGEEHRAHSVGWGVTEDHCRSRAGRRAGARWVERGDVRVEATLRPS